VTAGTRLTVPNLLCLVRLFGSPGLVWLAWAGRADWCLGLFVALTLTDWLDGKLAIWLDQRTEFGARLDSVADAAFYACTLAAVAALHAEVVRQEAVWLGSAVAAYGLNLGVGLARHRRLPSYHTRLAKTSWLLVAVAVVAVFAGWSVWPLRLAAAGVVLANLEAALISLLLPEWRADVPSVLHARRLADHPISRPGGE
jgi:cardiolipin synthase (CMP-forming)